MGMPGGSGPTDPVAMADDTGTTCYDLSSPCGYDIGAGMDIADVNGPFSACVSDDGSDDGSAYTDAEIADLASTDPNFIDEVDNDSNPTYGDDVRERLRRIRQHMLNHHKAYLRWIRYKYAHVNATAAINDMLTYGSNHNIQ